MSLRAGRAVLGAARLEPLEVPELALRILHHTLTALPKKENPAP